MGQYKRGFICNETGQCYAKANGLCGILDDGNRTIVVDDETPILKALFRVRRRSSVTVAGKQYKDGECPFRKDCRNDIVVNRKVKKRGERKCFSCMFSPTCKRGME